MNESLLDIVFEDDEVVFRNFLGYRVGERRKTTDIWGRNRRVSYFDEFGNVVSSAREVRPLFGGTPYVEFYGKDKRPRGRAYITKEILSGRRKIEYKNNEGKTISTRYVDEEKVLRNNAVNMEAAANLEKNVVSTLEFEHSTPLVLCCVMFLGIGLNALLAYLHAQMDTIIRYGSAIGVYVVCPLMVVLYVLLCRTKRPSLGLRVFHLMHLLLYTAGFAFVAYMTDSIFADRDINFFPQVTGTLLGLLALLMPFAPTLVLGTVSGIWTLLCKRRDTYQQRVAISRHSMNLMRIGNLIPIAVSMAIMVFNDVYGSGGFNGLVSAVTILIILTLLIFLAGGIAYLPYELLSKKF